MAKKIKLEEGQIHKIKGKKPVVLIIFLILSLIATGVLGFLYYQSLKDYKTLDANYNKLLKINNDLENENEEVHNSLFSIIGTNSVYYIKNKLKFLDEKIVMQLDGYGNYYYSYDCVQKITSSSYSYWAYNKEAAIGKGLKEGTC